MGVDLYAGPLARYYTRNWETPSARFSRENQLEHRTFYAPGGPPIALAPAVASARVEAFRERMRSKLGALPNWSLDAAGPYEALQLTHQGLDALLLATAHRHRPDLILPRDLSDDVQSHPAVSEASDQGYYIGPLAVFESHIIVPGSEARICSDKDCIGNSVVVSTTAALRDAIEAMMEYLDLSPERLDECLAAGPPFVTPQLMQITEWKSHPAILPANPVRAHAAWGLACFGACFRFAMKAGVAIIRDE